MNMKKYYIYHLLISFIVIFILLLIPLLIFYNLKINNKFEKLKSHEANVLELQKAAIDKKLNVVIDDLLLLAELVKRAGESNYGYQTSESEKQQLEDEFEAFYIGTHRNYDQLRLLDENGYEVIRINLTSDTVRIVKEKDLQNKSERYYFTALSKLKTDEVYMSPFDLNIEHDTVEQPYKPMIRFGTPLFDDDSIFKGAVVINYLGEDILAALDNYSSLSEGYNMMLTEEGYWLRNSFNPSLEWNFMFDSINAVTFKDVFKESWDTIKNHKSGQIKDEKGILTYQSVYPIQNENYHYIIGSETERNIKIFNANGQSWKLVSFLENSLIQAQLTPIIHERNIFILIIVFISVSIALLVSKIRLREIKAKNNLRHLNNKLEDKVTERTEAFLEAKEKAEESDRLKTAFLQNMSHEIRTPLNAILGFASLLEHTFNDKKRLKENTDIINRRGHDLLNIVNDILDISIIESKQFTLREENCSLQKELNELYNFFIEYREKINKSHIELEFDIQIESINDPILIDIGRLKQVLINLLNNAFKFTEQGKITLSCTTGDKEILNFSVSDSGIGIPLDKQEVIFNRFMQSDNSITRQYGGTGLGLSIVKELVHLLGGEIHIESTPEKGSIFYFSVPYKKHALESTKEINFKETNSLHDSLDILIVEDDLINIEYFKEIFKQTNHQLYFAEKGNDAIQLAKSKDFDLILMDIKLPDINGIEVIKQIRKNNKTVKIIAQTAYATEADRDIALKSGCNNYITKPIDKEHLKEMIYWS